MGPLPLLLASIFFIKLLFRVENAYSSLCAFAIICDNGLVHCLSSLSKFLDPQLPNPNPTTKRHTVVCHIPHVCREVYTRQCYCTVFSTPIRYRCDSADAKQTRFSKSNSQQRASRGLHIGNCCSGWNVSLSYVSFIRRQRHWVPGTITRDSRWDISP